MVNDFLKIYNEVMSKLSDNQKDFTKEENVKFLAKKMYDAGFEVGFYSNN